MTDTQSMTRTDGSTTTQTIVVGDPVTVRDYVGEVRSVRFADDGSRLLDVESGEADRTFRGVPADEVTLCDRSVRADYVDQQTETVDVDINYTTFDADAVSDETFETARDIRCFGDLEMVTPETVDAYERVAGGEVSLDQLVDDDPSIGLVCGHVYSRLQGGRTDDDLGYDGTEMRSAMIGDVIVVDDLDAVASDSLSSLARRVSGPSDYQSARRFGSVAQYACIGLHSPDHLGHLVALVHWESGRGLIAE